MARADRPTGSGSAWAAAAARSLHVRHSRSTMPDSRASLDGKWYSRPPLLTPASAATASSVSAATPDRSATA